MRKGGAPVASFLPVSQGEPRMKGWISPHPCLASRQVRFRTSLMFSICSLLYVRTSRGSGPQRGHAKHASWKLEKPRSFKCLEIRRTQLEAVTQSARKSLRLPLGTSPAGGGRRICGSRWIQEPKGNGLKSVGGGCRHRGSTF